MGSNRHLSHFYANLIMIFMDNRKSLYDLIGGSWIFFLYNLKFKITAFIIITIINGEILY